MVYFLQGVLIGVVLLITLIILLDWGEITNQSTPTKISNDIRVYEDCFDNRLWHINMQGEELLSTIQVINYEGGAVVCDI